MQIMELKFQNWYIDVYAQIQLTDKFTDEEFILKIISAHELNEEIERNSIISTVQGIKTENPSKKITLVIYGIKEFCRRGKNVGRYAFERTLTEIQVLMNVNSRLIETAADLNITVLQFSKSVGDIPFKWVEFPLFASFLLFLASTSEYFLHLEIDGVCTAANAKHCQRGQWCRNFVCH